MLNTIILIIPLLLLISGLEWFLTARKEKNTYTAGNFAQNLAIGAIDQICSLVYFTALYFSLEFMYRNFRFFTFGNEWYTWVAAYIAIDFLSYWYHRFSHRVNILWAGHVTHHSSEHYNFSNGFRTSLFQGVNRILFWCMLPVFGFSPVMLVVLLKISGLYDFLLHTEAVPKLGILEKILVTPSQHRVHHGRNDLYIDKNYGSTFVVWDKLFGTFREETEKVEYGIKGPYTDDNPYHAIGYYYYYLWLAMKMTPGPGAKLRLLFIPPDQTPKPPIEKRIHPDEAAKHVPLPLRQYAWTQITWAAAGLTLMLLFKDFLSAWEIAAYSLIGIITIAGGAMLINGNYREQPATAAIGRLLFSILLSALALWLHPHTYALLVLLVPVISLLWFLNLKEKIHAAMN